MIKRIKNAAFAGILSAALLAAPFLPKNSLESAILNQQTPQLTYSVAYSSTKDSRDSELYKTPFAAVGKQAVALIMPESTGVGNENWTEQKKQEVKAAVEQSFSFWQSHLPKQGQLEMKIAEVYVPNIPYEFIDTPKVEHYKIFDAALNAIGYSTEQELIEKIREKEKADGVFIMYVANSTNSTRKHFPDSANYSFMFPNNKRIVVLSQSPSGITDPFGDLVISLEHESGHIFGANDLYINNPDCSNSGVLNWSSCEGITATQDELMRNSVPIISNATRGQTGIIDTNNNLVPDSVDREPKITINNATITSMPAIISFDVATEGMLPPNPIYPYFNYSQIKSLEAVVNGTSFQIALPERTKNAKVQLNISGLNAGDNSLEIKAGTQFGNKAAQKATIKYTPIPVAPQLISPQDSAQLAQLGTLLSWLNQEGTTQYHIQVIPFNNDGPGINIIRNAEQSYKVEPPVFGTGNYVMLPSMTYSWRVRTTLSSVALSENSQGWGPWSEQRKFKTPVVDSSTISSVSPLENEIVQTLTPTLQWRNSRGDIFYYEIQLSKDPNFGSNTFLYWELRHGAATNPLNSYSIPMQFPLEPKTQYFWRASPRVQGDGTPVDWSAIFSFKTP